jgi:hypothetical protein
MPNGKRRHRILGYSSDYARWEYLVCKQIMKKTRVEINNETGRWRFLDLELGVYSSEEWDTRDRAFKMSDKYQKKHGLKKYERT